MGLLNGKTALITGGARGQGRAHAVRSAQEGADVILLDITEPIGSVDYPLATAEDMAETVRQVEACDRRALSFDADVRNQSQLDAVDDPGTTRTGRGTRARNTDGGKRSGPTARPAWARSMGITSTTTLSISIPSTVVSMGLIRIMGRARTCSAPTSSVIRSCRCGRMRLSS